MPAAVKLRVQGLRRLGCAFQCFAFQSCFKLFQVIARRNNKATRVQSLRRSKVHLFFYSDVLLFYGSMPAAFGLRVSMLRVSELFQVVSNCFRSLRGGTTKQQGFKACGVQRIIYSIIQMFIYSMVQCLRRLGFAFNSSNGHISTFSNFHINTSAH